MSGEPDGENPWDAAKRSWRRLWLILVVLMGLALCWLMYMYGYSEGYAEAERSLRLL